MPALLRNTDCPCCGHRHHFCLPDDHPSADREYSYVCPETGSRASLRPTAARETVRWYPQGAVQLEALRPLRAAA